jgi:glycosyltransferase involved in cell wall biosynthesis
MAAGVQRTVHTFHGIVLRDYFSLLVSWALLRLEARLAQRTSALVAVSPSCREELAELGVAKLERIAVVPPAVPLPDFLPRAEARRRLGLPLDAFVVAAYGRLVPIKRVEAFLQALAAMPDARGDVHGDGPQMSSLLRVAPSNVTFRSASADARACMAAYDALVLPSRREGCPLVAIEAFAAGVPVVGFDVPGVRDALGPWGSGILVPERLGAEGLASALRSLRASPDRAVEIAQRAKERLPQFAPLAIASQLLRLYESLPARAADS